MTDFASRVSRRGRRDEAGRGSRGIRTARGVSLAALAATAVSLGACGYDPATSSDSESHDTPNTSTTQSTPASSSPASSSPASPTTVVTPGVSESIGALCDSLRPSMQEWRVNGPTASKVSINVAVGEWGHNNNIDLVMLGQHRGDLDAAMSTACPDVLDQAKQALNVPRLGDAVVGVG